MSFGVVSPKGTEIQWMMQLKVKSDERKYVFIYFCYLYPALLASGLRLGYNNTSGLKQELKHLKLTNNKNDGD